MTWKCKICGSSYLEDCSPYHATCLVCGNEGNYIEEIAYQEEEEEENG